MGLGLGGAGADGRPADAVLQVLWRDRVECLGGQRQAQLGELHQQATGDVQAFLDLEGAVQVGVVDQTLPAHGGARLLEVDAHHDVQAVLYLVGQAAQATSVVQRGVHIVDRAGAHHHQQPGIGAVEDVLHGLAALDHRGLGLGRKRNFLLQLLRSDENILGQDVEVVHLLVGHEVYLCVSCQR